MVKHPAEHSPHQSFGAARDAGRSRGKGCFEAIEPSRDKGCTDALVERLLRDAAAIEAGRANEPLQVTPDQHQQACRNNARPQPLPRLSGDVVYSWPSREESSVRRLISGQEQRGQDQSDKDLVTLPEPQSDLYVSWWLLPAVIFSMLIWAILIVTGAFLLF